MGILFPSPPAPIVRNVEPIQQAPAASAPPLSETSAELTRLRARTRVLASQRAGTQSQILGGAASPQANISRTSLIGSQ